MLARRCLPRDHLGGAECGDVRVRTCHPRCRDRYGCEARIRGTRRALCRPHTRVVRLRRRGCGSGRSLRRSDSGTAHAATTRTSHQPRSRRCRGACGASRPLVETSAARGPTVARSKPVGELVWGVRHDGLSIKGQSRPLRFKAGRLRCVETTRESNASGRRRTATRRDGALRGKDQGTQSGSVDAATSRIVDGRIRKFSPAMPRRSCPESETGTGATWRDATTRRASRRRRPEC